MGVILQGITTMNVTNNETYKKCLSKQEEKGVRVLGFVGDRLSYKSNLKLLCVKHDYIWETTRVCNFLLRDTNGCKFCAKQRKIDAFIYDEDKLIRELKEVFLKTGSTFIGWVDDKYKGVLTKVKFKCKHGNTSTTAEARHMVSGRNFSSGCHKCQQEGFNNTILSNSDDHINKFKDTGSFHKDGRFRKSSRKTITDNIRNYWWYYCPECDSKGLGNKGEFESFIGSLKLGLSPCCCNINCQYIYVIKDLTHNCFKYGRTVDVDKRIYQLSMYNKAVYEIVQVFDFIDKSKCVPMETKIKRKLKSLGSEGYLRPRDNPDGHTETFENKYLDIVLDLCKAAIRER